MYKVRRYCVVVPAHNEEVVIEATLRGLIAAGTRPLDIYLVDDCSKDDTGKVARSVGVHVLRNDPNLGKARGIQRAVREFRLTEHYEFIGLMDADTLVDQAYFVELLKGFDDPEVVAACGRPISMAYNWLTAYRQLCYANGHYVYRKAQNKVGMITIAPGCATVYRSSIFDKLEWENDTSAEDFYITIQIYHDGLGKVVYMQNAKVYTQTPRTVHDYRKQLLRWFGGTWQVILALKIYWGNRKVDWECKLLWTEGYLSAFTRIGGTLVVAASPFFIEKPTSVPRLLWWAEEYILTMFSWVTDVPWYVGSINALIMMVVGGFIASLPSVLIFALLDRRWDIVKYSPLFLVPRYVDAYVRIEAFVRTVILKKKIGWFSPARYSR
jgi:cellulose synthase/poly-beta-1,6-N-acetylglucosamine synthase-like glycosyltransferase